jgi:hypothetical protein
MAAGFGGELVGLASLGGDAVPHAPHRLKAI